MKRNGTDEEDEVRIPVKKEFGDWIAYTYVVIFVHATTPTLLI